MAKEYVVTSEGLVALQQELEQLKTVTRKEVAEKIKEARGYGDLSENSEYDEAKNEQGIVESRIAELESILKIVKVVDDDAMPGDVVGIGSRVTAVDEKGREKVYEVVSSSEANPLAGKISDESPVGSALLGKRAGTEVDVVLPNGRTSKITIKQVTRK
ncbi:MAG: transcription elongation factor GreA [Oscillospiraceae bacterium]|nr:transcription elongation factor GreA [Oscillospiraceae bacterium]